jgi:lipid-binding SYLF domain-containing protein
MTRLIIALGALLMASLMTTVATANPLEQRVDTATDVLQRFTRIPEQGIPPSLLRNAHGIAVIPNTIKAGFMLGGSFGKGILVVRKDDGRWSNPSFINLGSGSFGFQVGAQSSDLILVFKTRRSVENIASGKVTLGGDASVAAGPVGRYTQAATDITLSAEIYAYSRTRGLFGGVSLEGGWLGMDHKSNFAYYESGQGIAANILGDDSIPTPATARRFIEVLSAAAPQAQWQNDSSRTASVSSPTPAPKAKASSGAKTFAIDDAPPVSNDDLFN